MQTTLFGLLCCALLLAGCRRSPEELVRELGRASEDSWEEVGYEILDLDTDAIPALISAMRDPELETRMRAGAVLGCFGRPAFILLFGALGSKRVEYELREGALDVLTRRLFTDPYWKPTLDDDRLMHRLGEALGREITDPGPSRARRRMASELVVKLGKRARTAVRALEAALSHRSAEVRLSGAAALEGLGRQARYAVESLIAALSDEDSRVACAVAAALVKLAPWPEEEQQVYEATRSMLTHPHEEVRSCGVKLLATLGALQGQAVRDLAQDLRSGDPWKRAIAREALLVAHGRYLELELQTFLEYFAGGGKGGEEILSRAISQPRSAAPTVKALLQLLAKGKDLDRHPETLPGIGRILQAAHPDAGPAVVRGLCKLLERAYRRGAISRGDRVVQVAHVVLLERAAAFGAAEVQMLTDALGSRATVKADVHGLGGKVAEVLKAVPPAVTRSAVPRLVSMLFVRPGEPDISHRIAAARVLGHLGAEHAAGAAPLMARAYGSARRSGVEHLQREIGDALALVSPGVEPEKIPPASRHDEAALEHDLAELKRIYATAGAPDDAPRGPR
jgi:HEAT repeat protein